VTITQGQYIIMDESPPPLYLLIVRPERFRECLRFFEVIF